MATFMYSYLARYHTCKFARHGT